MTVPFPPYAAELCLGAESQGSDERAPALIRRVSRLIERGTNMEMKRFMRETAAGTCGDGALVKGGDAARHPSTAALSRLWLDAGEIPEDSFGVPSG